jgi:hypothetical protein
LWRALAELVKKHVERHALGALRRHAQQLLERGAGLQQDGEVREVVAQLAGLERAHEHGQRLVGALPVMIGAWVGFARGHEIASRSRRCGQRG